MTTATINPHAVEVAHDTALVGLWEKAHRARRNFDWYEAMLGRGSRRVSEADHEAAKEAYFAAFATITAHEESYTGWGRFWLVTNTNGHIHRSTSCSTCFVTTEFALLPELSGLSEAEAVDAYGAILCTVCYPTAPVEWTNGKSKASLEASEKRAADKAARAAKKLEKALMPDGSEVRIGRDWISTLASAKMWLTDCAEWGTDHSSYGAEDRDRLLALVAAKTGNTVEAEWAAAEKRAKARR